MVSLQVTLRFVAIIYSFIHKKFPILFFRTSQQFFKQNGRNAFLSPRKIDNVEVFNIGKKSEFLEIKSLLFVSSNILIEPHPEEYLADRIRKSAAKMNIEEDEKHDFKVNKP